MQVPLDALLPHGPHHVAAVGRGDGPHGGTGRCGADGRRAHVARRRPRPPRMAVARSRRGVRGGRGRAAAERAHAVLPGARPEPRAGGNDLGFQQY